MSGWVIQKYGTFARVVITSGFNSLFCILVVLLTFCFTFDKTHIHEKRDTNVWRMKSIYRRAFYLESKLNNYLKFKFIARWFGKIISLWKATTVAWNYTQKDLFRVLIPGLIILSMACQIFINMWSFERLRYSASRFVRFTGKYDLGRFSWTECPVVRGQTNELIW